MQATTVRVSFSVHDALVRFGQSRQLCISDAIAELLECCGEDVDRRQLNCGRPVNGGMLGRPAKCINTAELEAD
jgi:hypothetical protein